MKRGMSFGNPNPHDNIEISLLSPGIMRRTSLNSSFEIKRKLMLLNVVRYELSLISYLVMPYRGRLKRKLIQISTLK
jgi:hypothetical protein